MSVKSKQNQPVWKNRFTLNALVTIGAILSLGSHSEGMTINEAESLFLANVARIESGSVTYAIEYFRPKDDVLGVSSLPSQVYQNWGYETAPVFAANQDLVLPGIGTFKWNKEKYISTQRRVKVGNLPEHLLQTQIWSKYEFWNGEVFKRMRTFYNSNSDAFNQPVDLFDVSEIVEERGSIQKSPKYDSLSFLELASFCPTLMGRKHSFVSQFDALSYENGLVRLTQASGRRVALLDPERACVPVQFRTESPLMPVVREIEYDLIEGTYFPISSVTTRFHNGNEVLSRITATLVSYEFNVDYPDSDFEYEFPEGVEVEDDALVALEGEDSDE